MDLFPVGSRGCCTGQNGDKHRESAERKCSEVWNQDALDGGTRLQLRPSQKHAEVKLCGHRFLFFYSISAPDPHINRRRHVGCMTQEVLFFWEGRIGFVVFESSIWEQRVVISRAWAAQRGEWEKEMSPESSVCLSLEPSPDLHWWEELIKHGRDALWLFSKQTSSGENEKKKV